MVKVDLTQKGNPAYTRLLSQYGIKGVPTLIFLDGQGKERGRLAAGGLSAAGADAFPPGGGS